MKILIKFPSLTNKGKQSTKLEWLYAKFCPQFSHINFITQVYGYKDQNIVH